MVGYLKLFSAFIGFSLVMSSCNDSISPLSDSKSDDVLEEDHEVFREDSTEKEIQFIVTDPAKKYTAWESYLHSLDIEEKVINNVGDDYNIDSPEGFLIRKALLYSFDSSGWELVKQTNLKLETFFGDSKDVLYRYVDALRGTHSKTAFSDKEKHFITGKFRELLQTEGAHQTFYITSKNTLMQHIRKSHVPWLMKAFDDIDTVNTAMHNDRSVFSKLEMNELYFQYDPRKRSLLAITPGLFDYEREFNPYLGYEVHNFKNDLEPNVTSNQFRIDHENFRLVFTVSGDAGYLISQFFLFKEKLDSVEILGAVQPRYTEGDAGLKVFNMAVVGDTNVLIGFSKEGGDEGMYGGQYFIGSLDLSELRIDVLAQTNFDRGDYNEITGVVNHNWKTASAEFIMNDDFVMIVKHQYKIVDGKSLKYLDTSINETTWKLLKRKPLKVGFTNWNG